MSNEWLDNLKVGDPVIYSSGYGRNHNVGYVERFTKTQIVIKDHHIKYRLNTGLSIGTSTWGGSSISEATPEKIEAIKEKKKRYTLINEISNTQWERLDTDLLEQVQELIK